MTEDAEFRQIYKLPVMAIPPNKPVIRVDENDLGVPHHRRKFNAVPTTSPRATRSTTVPDRHRVHREPEKLSRLLDKRGIKRRR